MAWTVVLDGALAAAARDAVRDIAAAVAATPGAASATDGAVFWAHAADHVDGALARPAHEAALDRLIADVARGAPHLALCGGLAGAGWTLGHVLDADADDPLAVIDEVLVGVLRSDRWVGAYDLLHGLVGLGVYLLGRIAVTRGPLAREGLAHVVRHLDATATRTDAGATWRTPPALLPDDVACPRDYFDCGVAHGVPGVISLLDRAARLADPPPRARALCDEAVRWLAAQRRATDPGGRFPTGVGPEQAPDRARAAWCYGDPGVAAALWTAAPALARETARDGAARALAASGVRDAGLCHGAAGLAHLNNRFFQATGEPAFADAARSWFAHALALRRPHGVAGVVADRGGALAPDASLLEGAIGVGLALLAALVPAEPTWDRLLLCDLPARAA